MKKMFLQYLKKNRWFLLILLFFLILYVPLIIVMYSPDRRSLLDDLIEQFFPLFLKITGLKTGTSALSGYIISYLYGFLLPLIPAFYCIVQSKSLTERFYESGLQDNTDTRTLIIKTRLLLDLLSIVVFTAITFILEAAMIQICYPEEFSMKLILSLNSMLLFWYVCVCSMTFLVSSTIMDSKKSILFSAVITIIMTLVYMKNPISTVGKVSILLICSIIFYTVGIFCFRNKDMAAYSPEKEDLFKEL